MNFIHCILNILTLSPHPFPDPPCISYPSDFVSSFIFFRLIECIWYHLYTLSGYGYSLEDVRPTNVHTIRIKLPFINRSSARDWNLYVLPLSRLAICPVWAFTGLLHGVRITVYTMWTCLAASRKKKKKQNPELVVIHWLWLL